MAVQGPILPVATPASGSCSGAASGSVGVGVGKKKQKQYAPIWVSQETYADLSASDVLFEALIATGHLVHFGARPTPTPTANVPKSAPTPQELRIGQVGAGGAVVAVQGAVYEAGTANAQVGRCHAQARGHDRAKIWFDQLVQCFYDGRPYARPILVLVGPAGCGKTFLTRWMAAAHRVHIQPFDPLDFLSLSSNDAVGMRRVEGLLRDAVLTGANTRQQPGVVLLQDLGLCSTRMGDVLARLGQRLASIPRAFGIVVELLPSEAFARNPHPPSAPKTKPKPTNTTTGAAGAGVGEGEGAMSLFAGLSRRAYCEWVALRAPAARGFSSALRNSTRRILPEMVLGNS